MYSQGIRLNDVWHRELVIGCRIRSDETLNELFSRPSRMAEREWPGKMKRDLARVNWQTRENRGLQGWQ